MIREADQHGLIISADVVRHEDAAQEVSRMTGWPTLPEATTWLLRRELLLHVPRLALFWIEQEDQVPATAKLVAWLREHYPALWRAVIAYRLDGDVEIALRSSGAQLYLPTRGSVRRLIEQSILPLIRTEVEREKLPPESPAKHWSGRDGPHPAPKTHGQFRQHRHPP